MCLCVRVAGGDKQDLPPSGGVVPARYWAYCARKPLASEPFSPLNVDQTGGMPFPRVTQKKPLPGFRNPSCTLRKRSRTWRSQRPSLSYTRPTVRHPLPTNWIKSPVFQRTQAPPLTSSIRPIDYSRGLFHKEPLSLRLAARLFMHDPSLFEFAKGVVFTVPATKLSGRRTGINHR